MAATQCNSSCIFCGDQIHPETKVFFIGMVEATRDGTTGLYGTRVKNGKLRIRHVVGGKPRGLICQECVRNRLHI